jgi:hypothetical protein
MRAHLGLEDVDGLKRKYVGEYVDGLLGLCEKIASYRIPVYFMDLDDELISKFRILGVWLLMLLLLGLCMLILASHTL